jgi:hypothetical protein
MTWETVVPLGAAVITLGAAYLNSRTQKTASETAETLNETNRETLKLAKNAADATHAALATAQGQLGARLSSMETTIIEASTKIDALYRTRMQNYNGRS